MTRRCSFSPRDYDNPKYIPYTFEEFKEYAEKKEDRYNRGRYVSYNASFFSDGHYSYRLYCDDKTNLWTVSQCDYSDRVNYKSDDDFYKRFDFEDVEVEGYYSWRIKKRMIPMTIEVLYQKLKPCYKEMYLENGKLYGREHYYGNEE